MDTIILCPYKWSDLRLPGRVIFLFLNSIARQSICVHQKFRRAVFWGTSSAIWTSNWMKKSSRLNDADMDKQAVKTNLEVWQAPKRRFEKDGYPVWRASFWNMGSPFSYCRCCESSCFGVVQNQAGFGSVSTTVRDHSRQSYCLDRFINLSFPPPVCHPNSDQMCQCSSFDISYFTNQLGMPIASWRLPPNACTFTCPSWDFQTHS